MEVFDDRRRPLALAASAATVALAFGLSGAPAQAAPPARVSYVALGDSYAAGTGAGAALRPANTPCWQSQPGYVDVVGGTGRVMLEANGACHGALLTGGAEAPSVHSQISGAAGSGDLNSSTGLISITAGANDVGFRQVLLDCSFLDEAGCRTAIDAASAAFPALGAGLVQTYVGIHAAAPNAKIAVMGYPRLFDPANGLPVIPPANQVLVNRATDSLNATIAGAAATSSRLGANAQFVDVTAGFTGHAANSPDPWLALDTSNPFADSNFHPNAAGHSQGYTSALMGAVKPAQLAEQGSGR